MSSHSSQKQKPKPKQKKQKSPEERVSRALSAVLRWKGLELGFKFARDGYTPLEPIMEHISNQSLTVTKELIDVVVETNEKKRFSLAFRAADYDPYTGKGDQDPIWFIRANQGHGLKDSEGNPWIDEELLLVEITDPADLPQCVHGTYRKVLPLIKETGLKKMHRDHIHLAAGLPGEKGSDGEIVISGMRSSCQVLVWVKVKEAMEAGMRFFRSSNGVILTSGFEGTIPPKFLEIEEL